MIYTLKDIAAILGVSTADVDERPVERLLPDSRKLYDAPACLFFALKGPRRDGHLFIPELYEKGVRSFVISHDVDKASYPEAKFIRVDDTLPALQALAIHHRNKFNIPVIGITGSNGKTITKEWLYQLLQNDYQIVRSPRSYNSQIGVPLSIWQMDTHHNLAIFEAGISQSGEMDNLAKMLRPEIGILTNIGEAHNEGFSGMDEKLMEKLKLFTHCRFIIARGKDVESKKELIRSFPSQPALLTWGFEDGNDLLVKKIDRTANETCITVCSGAAEKKFCIPFTDDASIQNAITCYFVLLQMGIEHNEISERMKSLHAIDMRMEMKKAVNNCLLINDSYSADINSLEIALNFQDQQAGHLKKTLILSDLLQSAREDQQLYPFIIERLKKYRVNRLIGIGEHISATLSGIREQESVVQIELYPSTEDFLQQFRSSMFRDEVVLVKGARVFGFERIVQLLELKQHQTVLEINLNAIVHNLKAYQRLLKPNTKIMGMVKAFAYGSGGGEIAGILQYHKIDFLGVAYADEGVELRKAGISVPIMVMNPEESAFDAIVEYNLEPDIYSFEMLQAFGNFLRQEGLQHYPVHIEIETGMNRLGFTSDGISRLAEDLGRSNLFKIRSVFSHLAASEDPEQDAFTKEQFEIFNVCCSELSKAIRYPFLRHIANTAAIVRHPDLQLDMVRLGIGLYGIDSAGEMKSALMPAASLKTTIAQIRKIKPGESVGYNRRGMVNKETVVATVRIGYADGFHRQLGNGVGSMWVKNALAPVIGSVCMDMTMLDITNIPGVQEGDEVIVFGKELPVEDLASKAGTIPYEIMTGISQRVRRVYFEE